MKMYILRYLFDMNIKQSKNFILKKSHTSIWNFLLVISNLMFLLKTTLSLNSSNDLGITTINSFKFKLQENYVLNAFLILHI